MMIGDGIDFICVNEVAFGFIRIFEPKRKPKVLDISSSKYKNMYLKEYAIGYPPGELNCLGTGKSFGSGSTLPLIMTMSS